MILGSTLAREVILARVPLVLGNDISDGRSRITAILSTSIQTKGIKVELQNLAHSLRCLVLLIGSANLWRIFTIISRLTAAVLLIGRITQRLRVLDINNRLALLDIIGEAVTERLITITSETPLENSKVELIHQPGRNLSGVLLTNHQSLGVSVVCHFLHDGHDLVFRHVLAVVQVNVIRVHSVAASRDCIVETTLEVFDDLGVRDVLVPLAVLVVRAGVDVAVPGAVPEPAVDPFLKVAVFRLNGTKVEVTNDSFASGLQNNQ